MLATGGTESAMEGQKSIFGIASGPLCFNVICSAGSHNRRYRQQSRCIAGQCKSCKSIGEPQKADGGRSIFWYSQSGIVFPHYIL